MKSIILIVTSALLSGCLSMPDRVDAGWTHDSHPLLGRPFGPKEEEDTLDTLGVRAAWHRGRYYMEMGAGRKMGDGGFYGDDRVVFTSRVGVTLWERK